MGRRALLLLVLASTARAQDIPGLPDGLGPASAAPADVPSFTAPAPVQATAGPPAGADSLMGLADAAAPPVVRFDDALAEAARAHVDLRVAREKVVQQEAQVKKAWSYLLPHVDAAGQYTFNCTFLGDVPASCADQTVQFADPEQLESQATLFEAIGDLVAQAAELQSDPEQAAEARRQSEELHKAADKIRATDTTPVVVQPAQVLTGSLNVSMPLFNGRSIPLLMNAYEGVDAVKAAGAQAKAALLYAAARSYYGAVSTKRLIAIYENQLAQATRHKAIAEAKAEAHMIAPLSLKRAQLDEIRARQQVRSAGGAHRMALGLLGSLLGRTALFDVDEPPPVVAVDGDDAALIERALTSRPEVQAQRHALRIAERTELDAWMMFLPSLALFGTARATSNANGFVDAPVNGAVGVQLAVPLYDGGLRYAALRESASRIREEAMRARALEERIAAQVRGNAAEVRMREESLALAKEVLAVAHETDAQAQALFEAGVGTSLDVSEASLSLTLAQADVARAELDLAQARLGLAYVVGAFPVVDVAPAPVTAAEQARAEELAR